MGAKSNRTIAWIAAAAATAAALQPALVQATEAAANCRFHAISQLKRALAGADWDRSLGPDLLEPILPQTLSGDYRAQFPRLELNAWVEELLEQPVPTSTPLSYSRAKKVLATVDAHPVAGSCRLDHYDPTGEIGFCFGVAEAMRLELTKQGFAPDSIRKIWAVGDLYIEKSAWGFHVATLARAKEGGWWVLDTSFGKPLSGEQWIWEMEKANQFAKNMTLYVTQADRVLPSKRFDPKDTRYQGFFTELYDTYLREHEAARARSSRK